MLLHVHSSLHPLVGRAIDVYTVRKVSSLLDSPSLWKSTKIHQIVDVIIHIIHEALISFTFPLSLTYIDSFHQELIYFT
jgi:hypothetical protein